MGNTTNKAKATPTADVVAVAVDLATKGADKGANATTPPADTTPVVVDPRNNPAGDRDANGVYTTRPADSATFDARLRYLTAGAKLDGSIGYRTTTPKDLARALGRNPDQKGVGKGVRDVLRGVFGTLDGRDGRQAPNEVGGGTANWRFHPAETPETWTAMVEGFTRKGPAKSDTTGKAGTATDTPSFR